MYIAIDHQGVDSHSTLLEEEAKQAALLRESLRQLEKQGQYDLTIAPGTLRNCLEDVCAIEMNIRGRMDFLNWLNTTTRAREEEIQRILEELKVEKDG